MKRNKKSKNAILVIFGIFQQIKLSKKIWFFSVVSGLLVAIFSILFSWIIGFIFDTFFDSRTFNQNTFDYRFYALIVTVLAFSYIFATIFRITLSWIANRVYADASTMLREQIYVKIQNMPISYFETQKTGDLMSAITNDTQNLTEAINSILVNFLNLISTLLVAFVILFLYAPIIGLISLLLIPLSGFVSILLIKKSRRHYLKQQQKLGSFNGYLEEIIDALPLVNLHQQQKHVTEEFDKYSKELMPNEIKAVWFWISGMSLYSFLKNMNILVVLTISIVFFFNDVPSYGISPFSFGVIASLSLYVSLVTDQFQAVLDIANALQRGIGSWNRIENVTNYVIDVNEKKMPNLILKQSNVEFKNVSFSYPLDKKKIVLENINFKIDSGKTVALVGATGCGKTTISKLLSKFYLPNKGDILIDDQSIFKVNEKSWRNSIGMITQDTFIFEDTIKNNLTCSNENITDDEIIKICKYCSLHEFIMTLPNGYETVVTHNGSNLSEGQRQLIAIARAMIANKPIVILDEATSNIDTITEKQIQGALKIMTEKRTMLVIAHRLSTIKNADLIIVIDKGKILEAGTHKQLIANEKHYVKLYKLGFNE